LTNPPDGVADSLKSTYGIEVVHVIAGPDYWRRKKVGTFCAQWRCIQEACQDRIKTGFVLRTDVWDVVFQDDPRKHVNPDSENVAVCFEGVRLAEERLNRKWIGPWGRLFGDGQVVNGGLICAPVRTLALLARLIHRAPLGTQFDQSELSLLVNALPTSFSYRPGFLECLYPGFDSRGIVSNATFCDRATLRPWCVVHANGPSKKLLDTLHPLPSLP
jgi:hypothetical protein